MEVVDRAGYTRELIVKEVLHTWDVLIDNCLNREERAGAGGDGAASLLDGVLQRK